MILRDATSDDESALESFDLGYVRSPWLDEVAEIVSGLVGWRADVEQTPLDRQIIIADRDSEIVAVAAHERVEHDRLGTLSEHRYLMVVAVRADSVISLHVGSDVHEAYAQAQRRGYEIVHPLTDEPSGVRRFFVRDPDENVINIINHRDE